MCTRLTHAHAHTDIQTQVLPSGATGKTHFGHELPAKRSCFYPKKCLMLLPHAGLGQRVFQAVEPQHSVETGRKELSSGL